MGVRTASRGQVGSECEAWRDKTLPGLDRLRAVVLLAGSVRANPLRRATGRTALELPVGPSCTLLDVWRERLSAMARALGKRGLPIRVMVERGGDFSKLDSDGPIELRVENDPSEFRGTAGLLSDLAREYGDDDYLLVSHAAQLVYEPLEHVAGALAHVRADVALASQADGTPCGFTLLRCGALRRVSGVGFVDLNEQALPEIAGQCNVRVVRGSRVVGEPVRTLGSYVQALRHYHRLQAGRLERHGPFAEEWQATFGVVESGAQVDETASIHDSVVLGAARVEAGAVVVRSVVCPGAVVGRGTTVIDQIVSPATASGRRLRA